MIGCDVRGVPVDRSARQAAAPVDLSRRARRTRRILVDTSPDLRQQALAHGLTRVDAILFTHSHADHILGLDEVRRFNAMQGGADPVLRERADVGRRSARRSVTSSTASPRLGGGVPQIDAHEIDGPFDARRRARRAGAALARPHADARIPLRQRRVPDRLQSPRRRVVAAGRGRRHAGHRRAARSAARDALQRGRRRSTSIARIAPRRAYLTHMTHDLGHAATSARLPAGVELAYDGLVLDVSVDVE